MELRRALLLFAIVLGLAAIATSVSRPERPPPRSGDTPAPGTPTASAQPGPAKTLELRFSAEGRPKTRAIEAGTPGTVIVETDVPGQAEIPSLGLIADAEPLTPARFDVLIPGEGTHDVTLRPGTSGERERVGVLQVRAADGDR